MIRVESLVTRSNASIVYDQSVHLDTAALLTYHITEAGDLKGHRLRGVQFDADKSCF